MKKLFLVIIISIFLFPTISIAQSVCGTHSAIVKRLAEGYREYQDSAGIAANGNLMEIYTSKKGNWTIIFTKPGGPTCLMAVGENWLRIEKPFKAAPSGPSY